MSNADKILMKPSAKDCLSVANSLITRCKLSVPPVKHVAAINSNLVVLLYEKITGTSMQDLIFCDTKVEEAHNVQAVINALSLDILQLSLSHITGEDVVAGDVVATYNLLHLLEGILLHSSINGQTFPKRKISKLKRREVQISKETISSSSSSLDHIERLFERNVELKLETTLIKNSHSLKSKSFLMERNRLHGATKPLKKSTYPHPCHKSYLLPYTLRKKQPPFKNISAEKRVFPQKEERMHKEKRGGQPTVRSQTDFIQELLEEFPCIQISSSLMKNIENEYARQLIRMHKLVKKCLLEKSKALLEVENVSKRQLKLAEILKKDMLQQQYLKEVKDERENERRIKYTLRDSRLKSAKMKQYSDEFILEMRKKMLKANSTEELIFKKVFKEIMGIQSEHVDDLCRQVRNARTNDDEHYLNYLNSLENLYQSQYLALHEEIADERNDAELRLDAERQALFGVEREFRERLENEIRFMQKVIVEQTEDGHFRELDASLYIEEKRKKTL